jgi:hypothetical protein
MQIQSIHVMLAERSQAYCRVPCDVPLHRRATVLYEAVPEACMGLTPANANTTSSPTKSAQSAHSNARLSQHAPSDPRNTCPTQTGNNRKIKRNLQHRKCSADLRSPQATSAILSCPADQATLQQAKCAHHNTGTESGAAHVSRMSGKFAHRQHQADNKIYAKHDIDS